jgi:hypothetical protein
VEGGVLFLICRDCERAGLVRQAVLKYQQKERWEQSGKEEERMGDDLRLCESRWAEVERFLHKPKPKRKPRKRRR